MRKFILILAILVLAGLIILYFTGNLQGLANMFNPGQTAIDDTQCAYVWATQPLPDISAKLQQRLEKQEVLAAEVNSAAYGENCVLADGSVARFLARQTDLYFKVPVTDIEDKQTLGEQTVGIINFVQDIPANTLFGTQSGYIQVNFTTNFGEIISLWFQTSTGQAALDAGLHGADLFNRLLTP